MARGFASTENLATASTPVTAAPVTLAAWAYFVDDPASGDISVIAVTDGNTDDYFIVFAQNNPACLEVTTINGVTEAGAQTTSAPSQATWHHCCGVFASATSRAAYLDGGNKGTDTNSVTPVGLADIMVGANINAEVGAVYVAEAAVWNVALTDAEVAILSKGINPLFVRPESLVFYAPLVRDNDKDIVGGLSLTAAGSPSVQVHPRIRYPAPTLYSYPASALADLSIKFDHTDPSTNGWVTGVRVYP